MLRAVQTDEPPGGDWPAEVAAVVGRRVALYRKARKMTAAGVSQALAELGVTMKRPVLSNLENATRGTVTVAEVIALGHVLNVPPLALVFPLGTEQAFPLLPGVPYSPDAAERWFTGADEHPIPVDPADRDLWLNEVERLALLREHRDLVDEWTRLHRVLDGSDPRSSNTRLVEVAADRTGEIEDKLRTLRRRIRRDDLEPTVLPEALAHLDAS